MTTRARALAVALLVGAAAAGTVLVATPFGPGVSPDSVHYIRAARELLAGRGLSTADGDQYGPMIWFPPLYPLMLGAGGLFGLDPLVFSRYLSAAFLLGNVFLSSWMLYCASGSPALCAWGAVLVAAAPAVVSVHLWAWSEPTFIFLVLGGLGLLCRHVLRGDHVSLLGSAAACGLAAATRYVGGMLVPFGLAAIATLSRRPWRHRTRDLALFAAVSLAPPAAWSLRNRLISGVSTGRQFSYFPLRVQDLQDLLQTLTSWILPSEWVTQLLVAILLAGGSLAGVALLFWPRLRAVRTRILDAVRNDTLGTPLAVYGGFCLFYLVVLVCARLFVDYGIPLNYRLLGPLYPVALLAGLTGGRLLWLRMPSSAKARIGPRAPALAACYLLLLDLGGTGRQLALSANIGLGYNSRAWRESRTIAWIERHARMHPIYTNRPDALYIRSGISGFSLPARSDTVKAEAMSHDLTSRKGYIVYFDAPSHPRMLGLDEVRRMIPLKEISSEIFAYRPAKAVAR